VECARAMFPNQKMIATIDAVIAMIDAVLQHLRLLVPLPVVSNSNYTTW